MKKRFSIVFCAMLSLLCYSKANAQTHSFYQGISCYLSSKYSEAIIYLNAAERTSPYIYTPDIYFINGICHYYSGEYQLSLVKLDSALSVWNQCNAMCKSDFFNKEQLMKYRAMSYSKLEDTLQERAVLKAMSDSLGSQWASDRLESIEAEW